MNSFDSSAFFAFSERKVIEFTIIHLIVAVTFFPFTGTAIISNFELSDGFILKVGSCEMKISLPFSYTSYAATFSQPFNVIVLSSIFMVPFFIGLFSL